MLQDVALKTILDLSINLCYSFFIDMSSIREVVKITDFLESMCVGELAAVLYRQYQSYISSKLIPYDVSFAEFTVLAVIPPDADVSQVTLANRLLCDNAMITRSLKTLAEKGLITRHKSDSDKRTSMVSLTSQGKEMKACGLEKRAVWKNKVMAGISQEDEARLLTMFRETAQRALQLHNKHGGSEE